MPLYADVSVHSCDGVCYMPPVGATAYAAVCWRRRSESSETRLAMPMYAHECSRMLLYIYIYVHTHTHTHTQSTPIREAVERMVDLGKMSSDEVAILASRGRVLASNGTLLILVLIYTLQAYSIIFFVFFLSFLLQQRCAPCFEYRIKLGAVIK